MVDRLLAILQKADQERMAQRAAEGSPVPTLDDGNPNVRMGKALENVTPSQHNFTPPDIPKAQPTIVGPTAEVPLAPPMPGGGNNIHQTQVAKWQRDQLAAKQAEAAIAGQEAGPRPQLGPDGDRLKQLLAKAGADLVPTPAPPTPAPDQTNGGQTI